jgi:hypothetical protein
VSWTPEQVVALAPDAAAAKAGRDLAHPRKWQSIGRSECAVWGECSGSAAQPYRTAVDLEAAAFTCTCPSRKLPCKHGLGLFLLLAGSPATVPSSQAPAWVEEWLRARAKRAERRETPAEPKDPSQLAAEQERRAARRAARVQDGVAELELWLRDLVRQGLSELPSRKRDFWSQPAQRMVDAQAPGLARMLNEIAVVPYSGPGWPDRMLGRIGRLALLLEGYRRLDELPDALQSVTRAAIGFTESREDVLAGPRVPDSWIVLGRSTHTEDRLRVQRTWLRGLRGQRNALVLDFAAPGQALDTTLVPGTVFDGALAFYRGAPLRAVVADRAPPRALEQWSGSKTIREALEEFAQMWSREPWAETLPCPLVGVIPVPDGDAWHIADSEGLRLPLNASADGWTLLAMSGGRPMNVFGEWNGEHLAILSAWAEGDCVHFGAKA